MTAVWGIGMALAVTVTVHAASPQEMVRAVELTQSYDKNTKQFIHTMGGSEQFSSSIPQNMISSSGVRFNKFSENMVYILERNGRELDYESGQTITEGGQYRLRLMIFPQINLKGMEEPTMEQLESDSFSLKDMEILDRDYTMTADFTFTIVDAVVSDLNYVRAPKGYQMAVADLDGQAIGQNDQSWCRTAADGSYEIRFQPMESEAGMPDLNLVFRKDSRPPLLRFDGVDELGCAVKSFSYTCEEEESTVTVYREGRQVEKSTGEIQTPGLYRLVVKDLAGNGTSYLVHLKAAYPFTLLFLLLGGIAALAGGAFLVFKHQKLLVR